MNTASRARAILKRILLERLGDTHQVRRALSAPHLKTRGVQAWSAWRSCATSCATSTQGTTSLISANSFSEHRVRSWWHT